jgi:hypothetical protein
MTGSRGLAPGGAQWGVRTEMVRSSVAIALQSGHKVVALCGLSARAALGLSNGALVAKRSRMSPIMSLHSALSRLAEGSHEWLRSANACLRRASVGAVAVIGGCQATETGETEESALLRSEGAAYVRPQFLGYFAVLRAADIQKICPLETNETRNSPFPASVYCQFPNGPTGYKYLAYREDHFGGHVFTHDLDAQFVARLDVSTLDEARASATKLILRGQRVVVRNGIQTVTPLSVDWRTAFGAEYEASKKIEICEGTNRVGCPVRRPSEAEWKAKWTAEVETEARAVEAGREAISRCLQNRVAADTIAGLTLDAAFDQNYDSKVGSEQLRSTQAARVLAVPAGVNVEAGMRLTGGTQWFYDRRRREVVLCDAPRFMHLFYLPRN